MSKLTADGALPSFVPLYVGYRQTDKHRSDILWYYVCQNDHCRISQKQSYLR
ncbi:hypothetical protein PILCRDRAFT_818561 [Piloderma croceum F 1598]|uniref:Uncharacterized protein n=1 Tax=Piloderma croceum (strain F 1598) TaxID=765440 RepID=A0A0C3G0N1_PILCF|nr:hypothetical protein PILCRDRAFT_818561 [Piloderma croceum F 1598]